MSESSSINCGTIMFAIVLDITYPTLYPPWQGSILVGGGIIGGGHPNGSYNNSPLGVLLYFAYSFVGLYSSFKH